MRITERLSGSHSYQEAIESARIDERLTVTRKLDKPRQWFVIDHAGVRLGILTAASPTAKRLNAAEHLVHARIVSIIRSGKSLALQVEFLVRL